jgi:hypothetical protein
MQVFIENFTGEPLEYSYDLIQEDGAVRLDYSNTSYWNPTHRGMIAGYLVDDGEGLVIKIDDMRKIVLDYDQAQRLLVLLLDNNEAKIQLKSTQITKEI